MFKVKVRDTLLALFVPFLLHATPILKDDILKPEASKLIEEMANELLSKTGIHGYVVASNEHFPEKFNLVAYSKKYETKISKPYVILILAPNAVVTNKSEAHGRVAVFSSDKEIDALYTKSDVIDATIDIIAVKDSNSIEDKHNIGIVQGFSELADQIANSKHVKMTTTLPNDTHTVVMVLKVIVFIGTILVFWIFLFQPLYRRRIKHGRQ